MPSQWKCPCPRRMPSAHRGLLSQGRFLGFLKLPPGAELGLTRGQACTPRCPGGPDGPDGRSRWRGAATTPARPTECPPGARLVGGESRTAAVSLTARPRPGVGHPGRLCTGSRRAAAQPVTSGERPRSCRTHRPAAADGGGPRASGRRSRPGGGGTPRYGRRRPPGGARPWCPRPSALIRDPCGGGRAPAGERAAGQSVAPTASGAPCSRPDCGPNGGIPEAGRPRSSGDARAGTAPPPPCASLASAGFLALPPRCPDPEDALFFRPSPRALSPSVQYSRKKRVSPQSEDVRLASSEDRGTTGSTARQAGCRFETP